MMPVRIVAVGAVSALGTARQAYAVGAPGEPARTAIAVDPELEAAGFRRPQSARAHAVDGVTGDRAKALLELAARDLARNLDEHAGGWRSRRVALLVGTSGGGMPSQTRLFAEREAGRPIDSELARAATYFGPLPALTSALGLASVHTVQVLAACASSTLAIGLGCRWLELDEADLVIAGGYDALSQFIVAGFESLGATSEGVPQPFRAERDGMVIGEGAALCALSLSGDSEPLGHVLGFGASSDAVHITAPDRSGAGLGRAASAALADATSGVPQIVSAHGTATPFNDSAEALAMERALGSAADQVVVLPYKAVIGHTLGAAGVLESLAALDAIDGEVLPAAVGSGETEPVLRGRLLAKNEAGRPRRALKLSAAFGGANAALVLGEPGAGRRLEPRPVGVTLVGGPMQALDLDRVMPHARVDRNKLTRIDDLSALVVAALGNLLERRGSELDEDTGIVVGTAAATLEINDRFDSRRRSRGPRAVEPRKFPPTSPNLCCGVGSIAYGLRGPSLAVGASPGAAVEALLVGHDLVAAGDAAAILVVAAEDVGEVVRDVWQAAGWPVPRPGAAACLLEADEGRAIDRARLVEAWQRAVAADGRLGAADPGWPTLLAAVETASASD